jgi:hypothetical protein
MFELDPRIQAAGHIPGAMIPAAINGESTSSPQGIWGVKSLCYNVCSVEVAVGPSAEVVELADTPS